MATLIQQWNDKLENMQEADREEFTTSYYDRETELYKQLLGNPKEIISGTFDELTSRFGFDSVIFAGVIDGINDSLLKPYDLDALTGESEIRLEVDFEKLYWNMLEANAPWLHGLDEWDSILTEERRKEIDKERKRSKQAVSQKVDRNAPCPCGSGKKYKKCCGAA